MERRRDQGGLHRRRCVCCGFDGDRLQGAAGSFVFACPSCSADLYARPARSYAELEGLAASDRGWSAERFVRGKAVRWILRRVLRGVAGDAVRRSLVLVGRPVYGRLVRGPADRSLLAAQRGERPRLLGRSHAHDASGMGRPGKSGRSGRAGTGSDADRAGSA